MIELGPIWLLRPWWILPVALLVPAALLILRRRAHGGVWSQHVDPDLMAAMRSLGHVVFVPATATIIAGLAIAAIVSVALIGPAQRNAEAPSFSNLEGIVVVIDMSPSIAHSTALDDAKAAAARVMQTAGGRPVALVAFAGETYALSALTTDPGSLETVIAALGADTMPDEGSRADRGLLQALSMLKETGVRGGDVVLITDGGGLGPQAQQIALDIRHTGARLHGIFVQPGEAIYGAPPADRNKLELLLQGSRGRMLTMQTIGEAMAAAQSGIVADRTFANVAFRDFGRYLLALAFLPGVLLFRRRS